MDRWKIWKKRKNPKKGEKKFRLWSNKFNRKGFRNRKTAVRFKKSIKNGVTRLGNPSLGAAGFKIYSRASWGARPASVVRRYRWPSGISPTVHHTAGDFSGRTRKAEQQHMRFLQSFHMDSRNWSDIGYNFVIFPSGRVYEGRGKNVIGAHAPSRNTTPGIAFVGDYSTRSPSKASVSSYKRLVARLDAKGKGVPHRSVYSTSCPGNGVMKALDL